MSGEGVSEGFAFMNLRYLGTPLSAALLVSLRAASELSPAKVVHRKRLLQKFRKYTLTSVLLIALIVVAVYVIMFGNYRPHTAIDTQWYLSYSYNFCMKGIDTDVTFGQPFPIGQGGTVAFGKLAAIVQCAALAPFNWSLVAANVLSVVGVVLSMAAIVAFLVGEGFSRLGAVTCCLALAATEPFLAMANQSKYEYVTFLLAVCGLLLAARRHLLLAGLISLLALEVQPIGIMGPIYLIAYELSRKIQTRRLRFEFDRIAKLVLGGMLGLAVYFIGICRSSRYLLFSSWFTSGDGIMCSGPSQLSPHSRCFLWDFSCLMVMCSILLSGTFLLFFWCF